MPKISNIRTPSLPEGCPACGALPCDQVVSNKSGKNDIYIVGYLAGMKAASEKAHEYGRRTYGAGGNKVRDVLHELGKELDKDVQF